MSGHSVSQQLCMSCLIVMSSVSSAIMMTPYHLIFKTLHNYRSTQSGSYHIMLLITMKLPQNQSFPVIFLLLPEQQCEAQAKLTCCHLQTIPTPLYNLKDSWHCYAQYLLTAYNLPLQRVFILLTFILYLLRQHWQGRARMMVDPAKEKAI